MCFEQGITLASWTFDDFCPSPLAFLGKALNLSVSKLSSYEMRIIDASCLPPFIQFIYLDVKLLISDHVFMHGLEQ